MPLAATTMWKPVKRCDGLALLDGLGGLEQRRVEGAKQLVAVLKPGSNGARKSPWPLGQRRIDERSWPREWRHSPSASTRSVTTSWVRSTAKEGMSSAPPRAGCGGHLLASSSRRLPRLALEAVGAAIGRFADRHSRSPAAPRDRAPASWHRGRCRRRRECAAACLPGAFDLDFDRGGAQEMAGIPEAAAYARGRREPGLVVGWPWNSAQGRLGVFDGVDRLHFGKAALAVALIELPHLAFLDEGRIGQHDRAEIDGGNGGMDGFARNRA